MNEQDVIQKILAGETWYYSDLIERYHKMVVGVCLRMTANCWEAEELAHETFVEAYLKLHQLRESERFGAWLRSITLNMCRQWYRKHNRTTIELMESMDDEPSYDPSTQDEAVIVRLTKGLTTLPPMQRMLLVLQYYEGLTYNEIATFLEIPVGTVMSRLHRAKRALKERVNHLSEEEEMMVLTDDSFKSEILAEIELLLRLYNKQTGVPERLSVLLEKAPDLITDLIRKSPDEQTVTNLALTLWRLGPQAVDQVLGCYCGDDPLLSLQVCVIIQKAVARIEPFTHKGWQVQLPPRNAYVILDRILVYPVTNQAKTELLMELLRTGEDEVTTTLLVNLLCCFPDESYPLLMEWFASIQDPQNLTRQSALLFALCRFGRRFCETLLRDLDSQDFNLVHKALLGIEALVRCLDPPWLTEASQQQIANELRTKLKWPALRGLDVGQDLVQNLIDAVADKLEAANSLIRELAVSIIGQAKASAYLPQIVSLLHHQELTTRLTVIRSVAEIGEPSSISILLNKALQGFQPERIAAIRALRRFTAQTTIKTALTLAHDSDQEVQLAAISWLAEIRSEESKVVLQDLMQACDKQIRQAAAKALYSGKPSLSQMAPLEIERRRALDTLPQAGLVANLSLDAALRYAIPEIRTYDERELTSNIARICYDYSATRRYLITDGIMQRSHGVYELTELGKAMWRVERFIMDNYLREKQP